MKQIVYVLVILSILLTACSAFPKSTPAEVTTAAVVMKHPTVLEPAVASETPASDTNVNCNELTLSLEPALASGNNCQSVAEAGGQAAAYFDIYPKYTELVLSGYALSERLFTPKIAVYPVGRFSELLPDIIPAKVAALQGLVDGGPVSDKGLPFLPNINAVEGFFAQYKVISFGSGKGIRYITQFDQAPVPVNNLEMVYTFQCLTSDGKYWISAILPISNPILPADGKNPPNGQSLEDFVINDRAYIADLTTQLNSQLPEDYSPTISELDALIGGIRIQP